MAGEALAFDLEVAWLPTVSFRDDEDTTTLDAFDGLWASPGSPYASLDGALLAIRFARERGRPFVAT